MHGWLYWWRRLINLHLYNRKRSTKKSFLLKAPWRKTTPHKISGIFHCLRVILHFRFWSRALWVAIRLQHHLFVDEGARSRRLFSHRLPSHSIICERSENLPLFFYLLIYLLLWLQTVHISFSWQGPLSSTVFNKRVSGWRLTLFFLLFDASRRIML